MRREIDINGLRFQRVKDPTATMIGSWICKSLTMDYEEEDPWRDVDTETALVLDRLIHVEDAIIEKERQLQNHLAELRGDMAIEIGPGERTLLKTGVPLVIQNGRQNITLTWSGDIEEEYDDREALRGLEP